MYRERHTATMLIPTCSGRRQFRAAYARICIFSGRIILGKCFDLKYYFVATYALKPAGFCYAALCIICIEVCLCVFRQEQVLCVQLYEMAAICQDSPPTTY